ncbi:MAG: hypothetical protein EOL87_18585 [Spartobacteria bacterium]|nr:hypothetical protein [Spartobacteria bacterium]
MSDVTNPHDKFFREMWSQQEVARDYLANYLPDEVIQMAGRHLSAEKEREAMTIAEQLRSEGVQQGMQCELREDISDFLIERFGECPYLITEKLGMIQDRQRLRELLRLAVRCASLAEFERTI